MAFLRKQKADPAGLDRNVVVGGDRAWRQEWEWALQTQTHTHTWIFTWTHSGGGKRGHAAPLFITRTHEWICLVSSFSQLKLSVCRCMEVHPRWWVFCHAFCYFKCNYCSGEPCPFTGNKVGLFYDIFFVENYIVQLQHCKWMVCKLSVYDVN